MDSSRTEELYRRAARVIPGGVEGVGANAGKVKL